MQLCKQELMEIFLVNPKSLILQHGEIQNIFMQYYVLKAIKEYSCNFMNYNIDILTDIALLSHLLDLLCIGLVVFQ